MYKWHLKERTREKRKDRMEISGSNLDPEIDFLD
jgi:hypothetical protein